MPALAAVKDAATLKKIDEALNVEYSAGRYDKAEHVLQSAIQACGVKACSGEVLGKAYVAVGVVRAKASRDLASAHKAFQKAKKADPNASLDPKMVDPPVAMPVIVDFYQVMGRDLPPELKKRKAGAPAGNMQCTPESGYEIQTAQPIAVVCEPPEGAVRAELHYRMDGESDYNAILMTVQDGTFRANIPCEPLTKPGKLEVYIVAEDFNNEKVDNLGSVSSPAHFRIVNSTKEAVPTYPGQPAPKRCKELLTGVGAKGEACSAVQPCKYGLYCAEGTCSPAPTCETNSECQSEHCNNGYCAMDQEVAEVETKPSRWMVGLHGGLDLWLNTGAKAVCGDASLRAGDYYCYNRGEERLYKDPNSPKSNVLPMTDPDSPGNVASGFNPATIRILASLDYVLTNHFTLGTRVGWAFGGGPRAVHYDAAGVPSRRGKFIPVHAELRGTYWFTSLGKLGFHPYAHLAAGMAEVDANTPINARKGGATRKLDAWHRMGPAFAGGGGGLLYSFTQRFGIQVNVNAMVMLPKTGIIIEPSLGGVVGF
ncbi:MAG TPA: hypothetical protein VIV60_02995 [Polyangiaceae bacterium]